MGATTKSKHDIIRLSTEELRKLQLLQLYILKEVDRICRKYGLKYRLCSGSLLGAVRHGGFIPWDDDIDITMLREEYDKFCEICKTELDHDIFFLQTRDTDPHYRLMFARMLLNDTTLIRSGQEHMKYKTGVFIDIFPSDNHSDILPVRLLQDVLSFLMRKTLYAPAGKRFSSKRLNRWGFHLLCLLPSSLPVGLFSIIRALNFKHNTKYVVWYGVMGDREKEWLAMKQEGGYFAYKRRMNQESSLEKTARKKRKYGLARSWFEEVSDTLFEDMQAMVPNHYQEWLETEFGNYMQLPPENEQVMRTKLSYYSFGKYESASKGDLFHGKDS